MTYLPFSICTNRIYVVVLSLRVAFLIQPGTYHVVIYVMYILLIFYILSEGNSTQMELLLE